MAGKIVVLSNGVKKIHPMGWKSMGDEDLGFGFRRVKVEVSVGMYMERLSRQLNTHRSEV